MGKTEEESNIVFSPMPDYKNQEILRNFTGLGLNLCYNMIKKLSGNLTLDSRFGQGKELTLEIVGQESTVQSVDKLSGSRQSNSSVNSFTKFAKSIFKQVEQNRDSFL